MAKQPTKRKSSEAVKAAADRAEARSAGEPIAEPKVAIDPQLDKVSGLSKAEIAEIAKELKDRKERKACVPYSDELANRICDHISCGGSLREFCEQDDAPARMSVIRWLRERPAFRDQYARAREEQADSHVDELMHIAFTTPDVQRARLMVDSLKWLASKHRPKRYGDKVDMALAGQLVIQDEGSTSDLSRRVALVLQQMLERRASKVIEHQGEDGE